MVVILRSALLVFGLLLTLAFADPEPHLTRQEQRLYDRWNEEYRMHRYNLILPGVDPISSYSHMTSAFPRLEIDALNWAHTDANGPYQHARMGGKTYVATTIRGDQGPALRWNLR
ncbi:uncharacterized protein UTRI_10565 [Ustilago trichophora]|uniref:Uncharacterized protein n=1 Tax=Ustilago trichophora TaxID=86804 RepID=A0A5C3EAJ6_9BASI|nr:uncharacterized protein UTRI_10565 [Ustilago trichophora]